MKLLVSVSLAFFSLTTAMAQQAPANYCGTTEYSPQQEASIKEVQEHMGSSLLAKPEITYFLPVQFHIVGRDDGSGKADLSLVLESLCTVNEQYEGSGIQFYLAAKVNFIDNTDYFAHDYQTGSVMMQQNNVSDKINVYIALEVAGNCGYFNPMADGIAVAKSCLKEPSTTLSHELGHFLSLPHTFHGWESGTPAVHKQERADGSNCKNAGDGFCDTSADYVPERWLCPYSGEVLTDPIGDTVIPDETQIMSYSSDVCQTQFSTEQQAAMRFYVKNYKQGLAASFVPYNGPVSMPSLLEPVDNEQQVPSNQANFSWNSVEHAFGYQIQISRFSAMVNNTIDQTVLDTTFTTGELLSGVDYYWRVRPLARRNTCTEFTASEGFTVSQPTGMTSHPEQSIAFFPNPVASGETIHIRWQGAGRTDGTVELVDLNGKVIATERLTGPEIQLNTDKAATGIYLLKFSTDAISLVKKVSIY